MAALKSGLPVTVAVAWQSSVLSGMPSPSESSTVQEVAPVGVLVVPLQVRHSVAPVVGL